MTCIVAFEASSFFTLWFFHGSTARVEPDLISLCDCPILAREHELKALIHPLGEGLVGRGE